MRESVAAEAIICGREVNPPRWLARWNGQWNCFHLVGGHKEAEESFRQCMIREMAEELGVEEGRDFTVSAEPAKHLEYVAWSARAQADTLYTVELFQVEIVGAAAWAALGQRQDTRWLTQAEIEAQRSADGKPISPTMGRLLDSIGWQCGSSDQRVGR